MLLYSFHPFYHTNTKIPGKSFSAFTRDDLTAVPPCFIIEPVLLLQKRRSLATTSTLSIPMRHTFYCAAHFCNAFLCTKNGHSKSEISATNSITSYPIHMISYPCNVRTRHPLLKALNNGQPTAANPAYRKSPQILYSRLFTLHLTNPFP